MWCGGWAATLAAQIEDGESKVWRQLPGDDTWRINLAYYLLPAPDRGPPGEGSGSRAPFRRRPSPSPLPDIVTYYRKTRPLRLVITGAAGAGKTVLAGCAVGLTVTVTSGLANELAPDPGMSFKARAVIKRDAMYGLVPQSRSRPAERQAIADVPSGGPRFA